MNKHFIQHSVLEGMDGPAANGQKTKDVFLGAERASFRRRVHRRNFWNERQGKQVDAAPEAGKRPFSGEGGNMQQTKTRAAIEKHVLCF